MQGAREYAGLFATGQYGKLYLVSSSHARGREFYIYVLPTAERIEGMPWTCKDAVEVYGIRGGQPGWTEWYGWLHQGPWQADFEKLVADRRLEIQAKKELDERIAADRAAQQQDRTKQLLSSYLPPLQTSGQHHEH